MITMATQIFLHYVHIHVGIYHIQGREMLRVEGGQVQQGGKCYQNALHRCMTLSKTF